MLPKRNTADLNLRNRLVGNAERLHIQMDSFDAAAFLSKTVELEDLDAAFTEFVKKNIPLTGENGEFPTYTLFSNERFSEYSQTWSHTDSEGNLLMDFKTVRRNPNIGVGENQGGYYNIPFRRKQTVCIRDILDDNGTESLEVYSMETPIAIDAKYEVSLFTSKYEHINTFYKTIMTLFQSIQQYLCPHGFYMPMKLEQVNDKTDYDIEGRKFFSQTADITLVGYLIPKESLHVDRFPKRKYLWDGSEKKKDSPIVDYSVFSDGTFSINSVLYGGSSVCEFYTEDDVTVTEVQTKNIRTFRIGINGEWSYSIDTPIFIPRCSLVKIKIQRIQQCLNGEISFSGTVDSFSAIEEIPNDAGIVAETEEGGLSQMFSEC